MSRRARGLRLRIPISAKAASAASSCSKSTETWGAASSATSPQRSLRHALRTRRAQLGGGRGQD
eukprot:6882892-Alexandrium_andersonii.AAC.1